MSDRDTARQRTGLSSDEALANHEHNPKYVEALKRGKLDYSVVPWPALRGLALAMQEGAGKYGRFNYRRDKIEARTYIAAILRHLFGDPSTGSDGWINGEDIDAESGLHHLDKVMACCLLVRDAEEHGMLIDNRLDTESKEPPSVRDAQYDMDVETPVGLRESAPLGGLFGEPEEESDSCRLRREIGDAINRCSAEGASNTPDFILAEFLESCLAAFDRATQQRGTWYGQDTRPAAPARVEQEVEDDGFITNPADLHVDGLFTDDNGNSLHDLVHRQLRTTSELFRLDELPEPDFKVPEALKNEAARSDIHRILELAARADAEARHNVREAALVAGGPGWYVEFSDEEANLGETFITIKGPFDTESEARIYAHENPDNFAGRRVIFNHV